MVANLAVHLPNTIHHSDIGQKLSLWGGLKVDYPLVKIRYCHCEFQFIIKTFHPHGVVDILIP